MKQATPPSPRTRVRRGPSKARYEPARIKEILDAAWLCHISIQSPQGAMCIPTIYARQGQELLVHGSSKSGLLSQVTEQVACIVVSIVDELVLARSAMHHSINYRSVVIYARAREITSRQEKLEALDRIVDHLIPHRSSQCRPANDNELKATSVYAFGIDEASAKIRSGPPVDDSADHDLDHWAGIIPIETSSGLPYPTPDLRPDITLPRSLIHYQLPHQREREMDATNK